MSGEAYGQKHSGIPIPWGLIAILLIAVAVAIAGINLLTAGSGYEGPPELPEVKLPEGGSSGTIVPDSSPVAPVEPEQLEKAVINDYFSPQNIPEVIRYDSSRSNEGVVVENLYITDVRINDNANNENTNIMTFWVRNGDQDKAQFLSGVSVTCRFERGGYQYWATHPYKKGEKMKNCELGIGPGEKIMFMVEIDDIAMTGNLESFHIGVAPLYAIPMDALKVSGK